jgi:dihydrofolate synthase / folylpolyglutamate synthase
MTYEEAIVFLESRIKWGIRPGTERVAALVEALAHPEQSYPVLHVSGTNGKYSVVAIVTAILRELGLKVGAYTSPNVETVRERIAIGGVPIDEGTFAQIVEYLRPYIAQVESQRSDELTYFELLTVMGFECFFDQAVHAAVVETGLGGEYDATNVADASVAVITNVTLDHVRQFGRDLTKAAWEKAGIAKPGSTVVTGVEQDDLFDIVAARAAERAAAAVVRLGPDFEVLAQGAAVGGRVVSIQGLHGVYDDVFLSLFGPHQAGNAALALAACEAFTGERLDDVVVERAFANVRTPGRLEVAGRRPLVLLDGGHNIAAALAVRDAIAESFSFERLWLVTGMLDDKLVEDVLGVWSSVADRFVVTAPVAERAAASERLASALEAQGVERENIAEFPRVPDAVEFAREEASEEDLVLVFGSFYTVGEAKTWLRGRGMLTEA